MSGLTDSLVRLPRKACAVFEIRVPLLKPNDYDGDSVTFSADSLVDAVKDARTTFTSPLSGKHVWAYAEIKSPLGFKFTVEPDTIYAGWY